MIRLPRLYAVADAAFGNPVELARELFDGGARLVQIRHKDAAPAQLIDEVEKILKASPGNGQVVVNDRVDVALLAGAAGVHLGQEDLEPALARTMLGNRLIGYSTHNLPQAIDADRSAADYIAVGPIFRTSTKRNVDPVLGLEQLRAICSKVRKPVVAIGGITLESAQEVFSCGAASVAIIRDLLNSGNVADRTQEWVRRLEL
jgi:thiamine-phosphate pyrophosphorylase